MLSYRHAFHAGNHADVLKHLILLQIAEYMGEKPAPFWIIDTHAGAGRYALESAHASKLGEYRDGTSRLWDSKTHEKLDKDRFRRDMGGVEEAYTEIMKRLEEHLK